MSGIPIYTQSPINAKKASGVTPQTATAPTTTSALAGNPASIPASTTASSSSTSYPPARPGAAPVPAPTGAITLPNPTQQPQPTPTTASLPDQNPPPPQPGAFPSVSYAGGPNNPSTSGTTLPPPPKAGEAPQKPSQPLNKPSQQQQQLPPYPPQMSFAAPSAVPRYGRSTATSTTFSSAAHPVPLPQSQPPNAYGGHDSAPAPRQSLEHPPGYVQNPHAAEMTAAQRLAQQQLNQSHGTGYDGGSGPGRVSNSNTFTGGEEGEGIWDTAKKWAVVAGQKASEAEKEVWRRINKE